MTIELTVAIIIALTIGAVVGWLIASRKAASATARAEQVMSERDEARRDFATLREKLSVAEQEKAAALARNAEMEKHVAEQKKILDEAQEKLTNTFKSLAADTLQNANKSFLDLANEKFAKLKSDSESDLKAREKAVENLVNPLSETLKKYQEETKALAQKRSEEMGSVGEQLKSLAEANTVLQKETGNLVNALKRPQVRGRWGEIALKRTAELAGMSDHCDFYEQVSVDTDDGRLRPDMIVKLPAGRDVIVDSKVSLAGYLEALETTDETARKDALKRHAAQVSRHVDQLSSKQYWAQFDHSPEFVVLFMPGESFLAAAAEVDPSLIENALIKKVIIATPSTLIALLRAIAYGWRQQQLTENARKISLLGQDLYDRMAVLAKHLGRIGGSLGKSVESYNQAVSSFETRVMPSARRFKELGISDKKEINEIEQVDKLPREVTQESPRKDVLKALEEVNPEDFK